jgi:hypothetical protein
MQGNHSSGDLGIYLLMCLFVLLCESAPSVSQQHLIPDTCGSCGYEPITAVVELLSSLVLLCSNNNQLSVHRRRRIWALMSSSSRPYLRERNTGFNTLDE